MYETHRDLLWKVVKNAAIFAAVLFLILLGVFVGMGLGLPFEPALLLSAVLIVTGGVLIAS